MTDKRTELADWAIRRIEADFPNDVCLLIDQTTYRMQEDPTGISFGYYVPATSRAAGLARTFIIDGFSCDLYPRSWERLMRMADLEEDQATCLADAIIVWARSDEDRQRLESLRARLLANLANPDLMRRRALDRLRGAAGMFSEVVFEEKPYRVRSLGGRICDTLATGLAYLNGTYFQPGVRNMIEAVRSLEKLPEGFADNYERVIRSKDPEETKWLLREMVSATKAFLGSGESRTSKPDFSELADWYQELFYTWRRIDSFCDKGDVVNAYYWCCILQDEVEELGAEFGIEDRGFAEAFDPDDLSLLSRRAREVEQAFVRAIEAGGVTIDRYGSIQEFLEKNG